MAGRRTKYAEAKEDERRKSISTTKHLDKLTDIQGKIDQEWQTIGTAQVGALRLSADISIAMLKKVLPDLQSVEFTGEVAHYDVTDKPMDADEWRKQYEDSLGAPARTAESLN